MYLHHNYFMAKLIRIGSSQYIRISKALIEHADLEGELELKVTPKGLLVTAKRVRAGWREALEAAAAQDRIALDTEWLEADLDSNISLTSN